MSAAGVHVLPLRGMPELTSGDDLAAALVTALAEHGGLQRGDVLVVSSKLVSKAAGLRTDRAREDVVRQQSVRVVAERRSPGGLTQIVQAAAGPVLAAAGVDASNTGPQGGLLLLPDDPDRAARELHADLAGLLAVPGDHFGVILSDTAGRPWRQGQTDFALGAHGVAVLDDLRGGVDSDGRALAVTARAVGDEIAAAADLVKGKATGVGAALLRGLDAVGTAPGARSLVRTGPGDWFALGHHEAVRSALGAAPGTAAAQEVGVPSVLPEDDDVRAARAVRLALLGHDRVDVAVTGTLAEGLTVTSPDAVLAGRVAARLEVALAGEGFATPAQTRVQALIAP